MDILINTLINLLEPIYETIFLTFIPLLFAVVFGTLLALLLYCTSSDGLLESHNPIFYVINKIADISINILRAIPFIILIIILIPISSFLTGSMLDKEAALPSLILAATPFFARMCLIAFQEVDKGTIEASKAMGATKLQIIFKVLIPESLPAIISAISVCGVNLVGYTAMCGAIGAGGLGHQAYQYGFVRRNPLILYTTTIIIIIIVFIIQGVGDYIVKKIDKR
ncbi:MAG: methionine ABC transporter permease [Erysipelotrichaceae bacterium]|nr:methionine ABC transporter permease [Erysipelotrichaceae bacterium]